nr:hypothetical protein CPGR_00952 [Mycolicibacter nonchromogenicus]
MRPGGPVEFHQASALAAFADEQPVLVHGDAVGAGQVVAQYAAAAGGVERTDPGVHHLGGVQGAVGVEGDIVGADDVASPRADDGQLAAGHIECTDLTAGHLRDIDPAVRTGAQPGGPEQPARLGEAFQPPAGRSGGVTGHLAGERQGGSHDSGRYQAQLVQTIVPRKG